MKYYIFNKLILFGLCVIQHTLYSASYIYNNTDQVITVAFTYQKQDPKSMLTCTRESSQVFELNPKEKKEYYPATGNCVLKKIFISSITETATKTVTIEIVCLTDCSITINNPTIENPYVLTWTTEIQ